MRFSNSTIGVVLRLVTLFFPLQVIHLRGFTERELQQYVSAVRDNLIDSMVALVDAMDQLGIVFEKRANLRNADRLREMSRIYKTKGKVASFREVTDILHQLWQDKGGSQVKSAFFIYKCSGLKLKKYASITCVCVYKWLHMHA